MSEPATDLVDLSGVVRFRGHFVPPIGGGGGLQVAKLAVGPDVVGYDAAALADGLELFRPAEGTLIYDVGIFVETPFDGSLPQLDVGYFASVAFGLFSNIGLGVVDASQGSQSVDTGLVAVPDAVTPWLSASAYKNFSWSAPVLVTGSAPLLVVGSQDGSKGGTPLDSTTGKARVYVLYAP